MTSRLEHKRYENKFVWIPYYKRISRFGYPLSNKIDDRVPVFLVASSDDELYFVNDRLRYLIASEQRLVVFKLVTV